MSASRVSRVSGLPWAHSPGIQTPGDRRQVPEPQWRCNSHGETPGRTVEARRNLLYF